MISTDNYCLFEGSNNVGRYRWTEEVWELYPFAELPERLRKALGGDDSFSTVRRSSAINVPGSVPESRLASVRPELRASRVPLTEIMRWAQEEAQNGEVHRNELGRASVVAAIRNGYEPSELSGHWAEGFAAVVTAAQPSDHPYEAVELEKTISQQERRLNRLVLLRANVLRAGLSTESQAALEEVLRLRHLRGGSSASFALSRRKLSEQVGLSRSAGEKAIQEFKDVGILQPEKVSHKKGMEWLFVPEKGQLSGQELEQLTTKDSWTLGARSRVVASFIGHSSFEAVALGKLAGPLLTTIAQTAAGVQAERLEELHGGGDATKIERSLSRLKDSGLVKESGKSLVFTPPQDGLKASLDQIAKEHGTQGLAENRRRIIELERKRWRGDCRPEWQPKRLGAGNR